MAKAKTEVDTGPASDRAVAVLKRAVKPLEKTFKPSFEGLENIPSERPILFVGNHVIWSGIDIVLMAAGLMREADIRIRPLGDRAHFMIPVWRDVLRAYGAVEGSRPNCARLMREGQCILVYPGGAREVAKRRGEKYKLLWGNRVGFAKMALEHDAIIVPFATVGGEEMWDIVVDANDLLASPIGPIVDKLVPRKDFIAPLVKPAKGGPVKMYFRFEPAIRMREFRSLAEDDRPKAVAARTKAAVESALETLFARRDAEERKKR